MLTKTAFITVIPNSLRCQTSFIPSRCVRQQHVQRRSLARIVMREADPLMDNPMGPPLVLCVGEVLYDLFSNSLTTSTNDLSQWKRSPGGGPANVASALVKLGTASAFIGNVGDDEHGAALVRFLEKLNINVDGVSKLASTPTRQVFVQWNEANEPSFVGFSGDNAAFADTKAVESERLPSVLFYAARLLATVTLPLAFSGSAKSLRELAELARLCQLKVIADVNWRPVFWEGTPDDDARNTILDFLKTVDYVKISAEEVYFLFGPQVAEKALDKPEEVFKRLGGQVTGVLITAAEHGASYYFAVGMDAVHGHVDAVIPLEGVVDTTGAGDSFLAGFMSELIAQGGPGALADPEKTRRMIRFAIAAASRSITRAGAMSAQPSREEVEALLDLVK